MNKLAKALCLCLACGMSVSAVACGNGSGGYDTENEVKDKVEILFATAKDYDGDFTVTDTGTETGTYTQEGVTGTETQTFSYKYSYNATTREYYETANETRTETSSESSEMETDSDFYGAKYVKDGDFYYAYDFAREGETSTSPYVCYNADKYSATNYAYYDENEVAYAQFANSFTPAWMILSDFEAIEDSFDEFYASDDERKLDISVTEENGATVLAFYFKGALSKTVGAGSTSMTYSVVSKESLKVVIKDEKIVEMEMTANMDTSVSNYFSSSSKAHEKLTIDYTFDKTGFDALTLSDAPEKSEIEETTKDYNYIGYYNVLGDSNEYKDRASVTVNPLQSTAKQVEEFTEMVKADNEYGEVVGIYTDEAMTKELKTNISDKEWKMIDEIYVKRQPVEGAIYVAEKTTYEYNDDWKWIVTLFNEDDCEVDFNEVVIDVTERTDSAMTIGVPLTVTVDGEAFTGEEAKFTTAGVHVVEYKIVIDDPNDFAILVFTNLMP